MKAGALSSLSVWQPFYVFFNADNAGNCPRWLVNVAGAGAIAQPARMAAQNAAGGRLPERSFSGWPMACFTHLVDGLICTG